jgi:hypothetical protein
MSTTYGWDRVGTDRRLDVARLRLIQEILGCVSGTTQTPEVTSNLGRPEQQELMDISVRPAARSTTSPRTALSTREASDPPNKRLISGTGRMVGNRRDKTHHDNSTTRAARSRACQGKRDAADEGHGGNAIPSARRRPIH